MAMGLFSDRRQRKVLHLSERRGTHAVGWFVMLLLFGALAIGAAGAGEDVGLVYGGLALFALVRWMNDVSRTSRAKKVEKASQDRSRNRHATTRRAVAAEPRAADPPKLNVQFLKPRQFPSLPKRARRVKDTSNVIGRPPLDIAYFRMFANPGRARTFLESAWREFGYVHLLQSVSAVSRADARKARTGELFVADDSGFADALRRAERKPLRPAKHRLAGVASHDVKVRDPFGAYPVLAIPCHVDFWRRAADLLLGRADLVVLDLSGFTERNAGTAYEVQRIIDLVPIERVVLLCDPKSDRRFLQTTIESSWSRMSARSPNASGGKRQVRCGITDRFQTYAVKRGNQVVGTQELRSNRKESRRLAAAAQLAAEAAPHARAS